MEGDVGTFSHCGKREVHSAHLHSVVISGGRYDDVQCNGTRPIQKISTGHLVMPAGPCTVSKLKALWMTASFAGPSEKLDHEASFDALIAALQDRTLTWEQM